ncbi:MAG: hydrogenase 4 subunit F [Peptococcaceae bacterium]|nr:hydrogenase 4 subunit F [Peptococcaceae bacterium]
MMPFFLLGLPLVTAFLCIFATKQKTLSVINVLGGIAIGVTAVLLDWHVFTKGTLVELDKFIYIDALGAYIIGLIAFVGLAAGLYSLGYFAHELEAGELAEARLKWYYVLFYVFVFTMLAVVVVNNLGIMWVAIEATTLSSALLVGYFDTKASLEAAWKYIIICTVGIVFALFGTLLLYFAAVHVLGEGSKALDWSTVLQVASKLNPKLVKLAFIFILVGYGTKVGLAPMHTWLPDAHSQAPSPVSALLSGVLLNCALYGILRVHLVVTQTVGPGFTNALLIIFGMFSVAIALPFILAQHDIKRLLAYSSIEHMGIITVAVGIGGKLALYGALLHMLNHAITKSALFFSAGNATQHYRTKKIAKIKGLIKAMPVTGPALLLGAFAIAGVPPFNIFISEFTIFSAGFAQGKYFVTGLLLVLVTLVFAGIMYAVAKMAFGSPPGRVAVGETNKWSAVMVVIPLCLALLLGVYTPPVIGNVIYQVATMMGGR